MSEILTIIIPCFNSEKTLESTLDSVLNQDFQDWEAIIVNDGSIDSTEEIALKWIIKDTRFKYYYKKNEGLGKARNYGISKAEGTYILPLDSDNLVEKKFASNAIFVFEKDPTIGVVYGNAEYFGEHTGIWKVDDYQLQKILVHNYIDACAIYKKKLWKKVGGYDSNMPYQGHEDWDFWIALGIQNVKFYHLQEITFKYFVCKSSMIRSFTEEMVKINQDYIVKKYSVEYHLQYCKAILLAKSTDDYYREKLKSKKIIINLFTKMFFGFIIFKRINI